MRIEVDVERCCGAGMCVLSAPEVFDQSDEDGRVRVKHPAPPAEWHDAVREAAEICPSYAIRLRESEDRLRR
ncbi:ferredoxin [Streptomyces sp. UNOB3_S3]|uniref:ferredoxin n=1 Tax=Streptomyces sp. UNOB3_S3 TaxID=2871682 RepID=UPI001E39A2C6|nr:ferredoxin [Streptomyces sp. UNOB3_S3]MCC3775008.1 ferredoxin [Streptomyces sp. UNOB3_S3]